MVRLSSGLRRLLLWLVLIAALGLIAALFKLGWLDPTGPIGPAGVGVSFLCSLVALIAIVGLAGRNEPVVMIDALDGPGGDAGGDRGVQPSFGMISLIASNLTWGLAVALVLDFYSGLDFLSMRGVVVVLILIILSGCTSLVAAVVALKWRQPRLLIPCVGALTCLPVAGVGGYFLLFALSVLNSQ